MGQPLNSQKWWMLVVPFKQNQRSSSHKRLLSQVTDNPQFGSCIVGNRLLRDAVFLHQLWIFQSLVCQSCCPRQGTVLCEQRRARCLLKGFDGVWLFPVDLWTPWPRLFCMRGRDKLWGPQDSMKKIWLCRGVADLDSIHALWGAA